MHNDGRGKGERGERSGDVVRRDLPYLDLSRRDKTVIDQNAAVLDCKRTSSSQKDKAR